MTPSVARPLIVFLAALATAPLAWTQPAARPFVVSTWATEDGLPQNSVTSIARTRQGYLWLGTNGGLARFDGVRFTVYNRTTTPRLPNDRVQALLEDRQGMLWVGTQGGGLLRLAPDGRTAVFTMRDGLTSDAILTVLETRAGVLWVGTEAGLSRFDGRRFVREPSVPLLHVSALYEAPDGSLWVGTSDRLHHLGGPEAPVELPSAQNRKPIVDILQGFDGALWVATDGGGVLRYVNGRFVAVPGPEGAWRYTRTLVAGAQNTLWVSTGAGLLLYDARGYRTLTTRDGLSTDLIRTVFVDREGSVWVGTDNGGLNRLAAAPFHLYGTAQGLSTDVVFSVTEDRAGDQWIGTNCGGIVRLRDGVAQTFGEADGLVNTCITSVLEDRSGRLWAGSYGGGLYYREGARFRRFEGGLPGQSILSLYEDRAGSLWIGSYEEGLSRLHQGAVTTYTVQNGLPSNWVRSVIEARSGVVYVATSAGVARLGRTRQPPLTTRDGLSSNDVRALYEDARGGLWIGTYGAGLNLYKDGKVTTFTSTDGLPEDVVSAIVEDAYGQLWMTGNRGITRIARADLEAFAAGRRQRLNAYLFGREAGIPHAETNGGFQPAAWKGADGRLWFPTFSGAAVIDPAHLRFDRKPPAASVEQVSAGNQRWEDQADVRLPRGARQFNVAYTGFDLSGARQTRFRYRLTGQDTAWVEAGTRRVAYFTNVAPGRYTFEVAAASPTGVWNTTPARIDIAVPAYPAEMGWVRLLAGGLLVGAVAWGVRRRLLRSDARSARLEQAVQSRTHELQREKAHAEEARTLAEEQRSLAEAVRGTVEVQAAELKTLDAAKSQFFANLSHEFRTPLTLIIGPLEHTAQTLRSEGNDSAAGALDTALRSARRLLRLIDQLLDLARLEGRALPFQPRPGDLVAFTREIVRGFGPLAEQRAIALRFDALPRTVPLSFDADALEKVVFNLLANALKFTPKGGRVSVRVGHEERAAGPVAVLTVRDSGVGMAAEQLPLLFNRFFQTHPDHASTGSGIGLALVRELVDLHGGQVEVASEEGFGSTFTVVLPAGPREEEGAEEGRPNVPAAPLASPALPPVAAPPPPAPLLPAPVNASVVEGGERPLVLLIEDNDEVRTFTREHLAPHYRVVEARNGVEGVALAFERRPHLVVTDVTMPEMDGVAVCQRLKSDPRTALTPILMLTARAATESRVAGLHSGADDYLVKPFVVRELLARVDNLLRSRAQLQEAYGRTVTLAPSGVHLPSADEQFVQRVRAAIEAHLGEAEFDVQALAAAVGISPSQLHRRVKALAGQPPVQLMRAMRLMRAAELLEQRVGTVSEVAYAVGFNNLSYFARAFREQFGHSPSEHMAARLSSPPPYAAPDEQP